MRKRGENECKACGGLIPETRLKLTSSEYCVVCERMREAKEKGKSSEIDVRCLNCGSPMVWRKKRVGTGSYFWGCSTYPKCKFTIPADKVDNAKRIQEGRQRRSKIGVR